MCHSPAETDIRPRDLRVQAQEHVGNGVDDDYPNKGEKVRRITDDISLVHPVIGPDTETVDILVCGNDRTLCMRE